MGILKIKVVLALDVDGDRWKEHLLRVYGLPPVRSRNSRVYLTEMTRIIFKHGETIDKFIGDAVMALSGVPVASASSKIDTSAAIRAALEMKTFIKTFEPSVELEADLRIRNRSVVVYKVLGITDI